MCKFCDTLLKECRDSEINWLVRSTYADDNICEIVNDKTCDNCNGCSAKFILDSYLYKDNCMVGVSYQQHMKSRDDEDVHIMPFTETMQWNFCPVCGKQISKEILEWDKYYEHKIQIVDNE